MKNSKRVFPGILMIFLLAPIIAQALPEYAMQVQQTCFLCHQSPNGAGARNLYGAQFFSYTDLPWEGLKFEEVGKVNPMINDRLQIGMDYRSLYFYNSDEQVNQFVTMQADVYLTYALSDQTLVYFDRGISGNYEAFAQFMGLPHTGIARVGKFQPSYGWRFDDHKTFVRQFLGFGGERGVTGYESGAEIGFYPNGGDVSIAITNGAPEGATEKGKAGIARAVKRWSFGDLNLSLGGSFYYSDFAGGPLAKRMGGGFGGFSLNRITYLGEVDWITLLDQNQSGYTGQVMTNLLRYQLDKGLYLNAYYDYYDRDIDRKTGSMTRVKLAAELIPRGYVRFLPAVEYLQYFDKDEEINYEIQVHLWF